MVGYVWLCPKCTLPIFWSWLNIGLCLQLFFGMPVLLDQPQFIFRAEYWPHHGQANSQTNLWLAISLVGQTWAKTKHAPNMPNVGEHPIRLQCLYSEAATYLHAQKKKNEADSC
jgi:hypothetical protein